MSVGSGQRSLKFVKTSGNKQHHPPLPLCICRSELTCQNPDAVADVHKDDGLIAFPIMADHTKLVTVGVCEWTITMVRAQAISEHATLKGNTAVVW